MSVQGRIVWHDLNTTNLEQSTRFYGELFAWSMKSEGQWHFIQNADGHFGTMMQNDPSMKMPSTWVPYLSVENIDSAIAAVSAAGGKVVIPKKPAGTTGNFSYVMDAQNVLFALWQYADGKPKAEVDTTPPPGSFCWDELLTTDTAAAETFYGKVIGYKTEHMEMPGMSYTLWLRDVPRPDGKPRQAGGMMKAPPMVPHPFWMSYVSVTDCDASMEKAKKLGATITSPPMDIPNVGRFTTMLDPTMAPIAILGPLK